MRVRTLIVMLLALLMLAAPAHADWRWAPPHLRKQHVTYSCDTMKCIHQTYVKAKHRYAQRVARYDHKRQTEWNHWAHLYIPTCTWFGESGQGPQYSRIRYTTPNSQGSGAYGKYQLMPSTYATDDKYGDWSPLDQEIAGHREYAKHGTSPWENC